MASLPIFRSNDQQFQQMQNQWSAILNPIIANSSTNPLVLKNISLVSGTNTVNHKLGQKLQGWRLVRKRAAADIYDNQDSNQTPQFTLILVSDAPCEVDIEVY